MTDVITASVSFPRQHVTRHRDNSLDRCQVTLVSWSKSKSDQNRTLHSRLSKESFPAPQKIKYALRLCHLYQSLRKHFFWTNRWAVEGLRKRSGCFLLPTPCEASTGSQGLGLIPVSHPLAETIDALHQPLWEGGRLLKMLNQKKKIWEVSKIEAVTGHLSMASARKISELVILECTSYFLLI